MKKLFSVFFICLFSLTASIILSSCAENSKAVPLEVAPGPKTLETKTEGLNQNEKTELKKKLVNCLCTQQWMPVCGDNGVTYSNSCFAKCAGVKFNIGSCEKSLDQ